MDPENPYQKTLSSTQWLDDRLDEIPRLPLANYPTPLQHLPRLSQELNRKIYIKRDDELGPGLGGNKTRKLEYLMADAQRRGARRVVTFGGLQSNHARLTAAAARKCGMEPHLFYFEQRPSRMYGNLLINQLTGARMHFIPFGGSGDGGMSLETAIRLVHLVAWATVGPHYYIPVGGHSWLGCLGYVRAAAEIDRQARDLGIENAYLLLAAGSGGTLAGLMAGLWLIDSNLKPLGIDVGKLWKGFPISIAQLATNLCSRLGKPHRFTPTQVPLIENIYVGQGYAIPSMQCMSAIARLARLEGILLDPVYTSKAFAGMLDLLKKGKLGRDHPVIFLHTGGLPGIFAFQDQFTGL
jgi:D-cysteine desulfhydrase family pyridoxal phosphate-dependent enzyme